MKKKVTRLERKRLLAIHIEVYCNEKCSLLILIMFLLTLLYVTDII